MLNVVRVTPHLPRPHERIHNTLQNIFKNKPVCVNKVFYTYSKQHISYLFITVNVLARLTFTSLKHLSFFNCPRQLVLSLSQDPPFWTDGKLASKILSWMPSYHGCHLAIYPEEGVLVQA